MQVLGVFVCLRTLVRVTGRLFPTAAAAAQILSKPSYGQDDIVAMSVVQGITTYRIQDV